MKPIIAETEIIIQAPIEKVWQVMLDTAGYPKWNPFVVRVETQGDVAQPGATMKLFVVWNNGKNETSDEKIELVKPPQEYSAGVKRAAWSYRFTGKLANFGLVNAIRYQWLEQIPGEPTTYRTREEFSGLLRKFIPLARVQDGFERQALALSKYLQSS